MNFFMDSAQVLAQVSIGNYTEVFLRLITIASTDLGYYFS